MRQSERVLLRVPIEVSGKGPDGNVFSEKAFTLVINRHGAQIRLRNALRPKWRPDQAEERPPAERPRHNYESPEHEVLLVSSGRPSGAAV